MLPPPLPLPKLTREGERERPDAGRPASKPSVAPSSRPLAAPSPSMPPNSSSGSMSSSTSAGSAPSSPSSSYLAATGFFLRQQQRQTRAAAYAGAGAADGKGVAGGTHRRRRHVASARRWAARAGAPCPLHQSSTRPWPGPSQHAFCASQILRYSVALVACRRPVEAGEDPGRRDAGKSSPAPRPRRALDAKLSRRLPALHESGDDCAVRVRVERARALQVGLQRPLAVLPDLHRRRRRRRRHRRRRRRRRRQ